MGKHKRANMKITNITDDNNTDNIYDNASVLTIKAKCGNDMRRFQVDRCEASRLPEQLGELFETSDLVIKYEDEDGDMITIVTPEDAIEAVSNADGSVLRLHLSR